MLAPNFSTCDMGPWPDMASGRNRVVWFEFIALCRGRTPTQGACLVNGEGNAFVYGWTISLLFTHYGVVPLKASQTTSYPDK